MIYTDVSPASDDVVDVVLADRQADDAAVDRLAAVFGVEILVLHLDPAERTHGEPHRIAVVGVVETRASRARRLRRTTIHDRQTDTQRE